MMIDRYCFSFRLLMLFFVLLLTSCSPHEHSQKKPDENIVYVGVINTESTQSLQNVWEPLINDMSNKVGVKFILFFASDYAGIVQAMRFNKIQVAYLGNKSAMEAVDRADGEVFAKSVYQNGETGYHSLLIVHRDSDFNDFEDILKHASKLSFGGGDANSTSGTLVPGYYLFSKNGLNTNQLFKRVLNSTHENNAFSVANKKLDVATFNTSTWHNLQKSKPEIINKLKIIWKSPEISSDPLVWRKDLDENLKEKIKQFLLEYGKTEREKNILYQIGLSRFIKSNNQQLNVMRELEKLKKNSNMDTKSAIQ